MTQLVNYEEALERVVNIENKITRSLVSTTVRILEILCLEGVVPDHSFDLLFFVKVLEKRFNDHEQISRILDGDTMEWPDI